MDLALDLIGKGYFPKELPPSFSTTSLSVALKTKKLIPPIPSQKSQKDLQMLTHSLARAGGIRRILGLPNPVVHYTLCREIADNWSVINKHLKQSQISISSPTYVNKAQSRAVEPLVSSSDLALKRAHHRTIGKYLLIADIAECYRSLYTHSIPWALHEKPVAKKGKFDDILLGNRLDRAVRKAQDGQTNGIPVGPDTSLILNEIVLSKLDQMLVQDIDPRLGFRYFDDYEFVFSSYGSAEKTLAKLQGLLADYGLQLNPKKTRIAELPERLESPWVSELRDFQLNTKRGRMLRIMKFFDCIFENQKQYPDVQVVGYAIGRIENESWSSSEWRLIEQLLFQSLSVMPSATQQIIRIFATSRLKGLPINTAHLNEILNLLIVNHAPLGHASEVCWAVWGLISFGQHLADSAATAAVSLQDDIVALLTLDARSQKLVADQVDLEQLNSYMNKDGLYGEHWLLAYEANVQGWCPTQSFDYINKEPFFDYMKSKKVTFYNKVRKLSKRTVRRLRPRRIDYS